MLDQGLYPLVFNYMTSNFLINYFLSYLIGSLSGSILIGKLFKVDIREKGSGNAGATNTFRVLGLKIAICVFIFDCFKGFFATYIISGNFNLISYTSILCGLFVIIGHNYPIFHSFNGGKGAATTLGVLIAIFPIGAINMLIVWIVILIISGYVSLSTIIASLSLLLNVYYLYPEGLNSIFGYFSITLIIFILFTHKSNIKRIINGTENRFKKIRLFK